MLVHSFGAHRNPVRTKSVEFGLLSPDEIRRMAVCEVKNPLLYCRGLPMCEGVIDFRMGPCDRRLKCGTCHLGVQECPGHCGVIELGAPMYLGFNDVVLKVLRSVCYFCGHLLGGARCLLVCTGGCLGRARSSIGYSRGCLGGARHRLARARGCALDF